MFPSQILSVGMVILVALLLLLGLSAGNPGVVLLLAVFPIGVYLISHPTAWLAMLVAIFWSRLTFPGAPVNLNLYHVLSLAFVVFILFFRLINRVRHRSSPIRKYVACFALILVGVGVYRGFGLRMLGSDLWGGSPYAELLIGCLFLLSADGITLTPRQWRIALMTMFVLTFLPATAQVLYVFSGGEMFIQYMFIQPKGFLAQSLQAVVADEGIARYVTDFGITLLYIPLFLYGRPFEGRRALVTLLGLMGALVLAGMSGSRYALIMIMTYLFFWTLMGEGRIRWGRAGMGMVAALILVSVVAPFAGHFPLPMQRAMSFIPWADVSHVAMQDAKGTAIWRMDVWERALREDVPRYWMFGRGFAFDPREYAGIQMHGLTVRDWAFVTGSYHSGPLSLLINLGVAGFVVGLGFFASTVRTHVRLALQGFPEEGLGRMHRVVLAMFVNQSFLFLTLGGDVQNFFPIFLFLAMVLEGLAKTADAGIEVTAVTDSKRAHESFFDAAQSRSRLGPPAPHAETREQK